MPNHIHGIIVVLESDVVDCDGSVGAGSPCPYMNKSKRMEIKMNAPTLGQIVGFYKYQSTKRVNQIRNAPGGRFGNGIIGNE
jgi:putative transposase